MNERRRLRAVDRPRKQIMRFGELGAVVLGAAILLAAAPARADEGMWTFDNFPSTAVRDEYGVDVSGAWLARIRGAITRHESGCTGSFASADGLVLTNHHCVVSCLSELSSPQEDLVEAGFLARTRQDERRCPTEIISVLVETENVTSQVNAALKGLDAAQANTARKRELSRLEAECTAAAAKRRDTGPLACESVTLYQGGEYWLYKYRRYDDVRLVFAPEDDIAAFGGDPDNFNFPRWCLDMSLLRVYEKGKPARTPDHLPWRVAGPDVGEPIFVAGHPGSTARLLTMAQIDLQRDVVIPSYIARNSELRGRLIQWGRTSEEATREMQETLLILENGLKVYRGLQRALNDDTLMAGKGAEEQAMRTLAAVDPRRAAESSSPWQRIETAEVTGRDVYDRYLFLEQGAAFGGQLFGYARSLVRAAAERPKPNEDRLREYAESNLPKIRTSLLGDAPVYPDFETVWLSFSLDKMREWLGPDDPVVHEVLGTESPEAFAARVVHGSKLGDVEVRRALWGGGAAAVAASTDPMIVLARQVDDDARAVRKRYEDEVQAPVAAAQEDIAAIRFQMLGTNTYPDATFTLRMSYGAVASWKEHGEEVPEFTTLARLYERATGAEPFSLPRRWLDPKPGLDLDTRFNYVTTNDIVGGNSGSPLIDAEGRLVGLAFDGNIHSIAGTYAYDARLNRAVAVHPAIMLEALRKVYHADALVSEILEQH
jgi:Peptidase S46